MSVSTSFAKAKKGQRIIKNIENATRFRRAKDKTGGLSYYEINYLMGLAHTRELFDCIASAYDLAYRRGFNAGKASTKSRQ